MRAGGYVEADDTRLHLVGTRIRENVRELVGRGREADRLPLHPVRIGEETSQAYITLKMPDCSQNEPPLPLPRSKHLDTFEKFYFRSKSYPSECPVSIVRNRRR